MESSPTIETIIRPNRAWWHIRWAELAEYQDLLWLLVRRDFVAKYKQTVLGPLWFVIQPLLTTLVFTVVFGKIAKISTDGTPPVLFYLCGLLGWNYFAQTFAATAGTFSSNAQLFGKVYFPRLVIPGSLAISNLFAFALNGLIFGGFWLGFRFLSNSNAIVDTGSPAAWLCVPFLVLQATLVSLGCGLWMAVLTAKYRDLTHVTPFLVQLWLYATPVIYPLASVPERWQWLAAVNPMTCVVEGFRIALLGSGHLTLGLVAMSGCTALLLFVSSVFAFNRSERTFIDTI